MSNDYNFWSSIRKWIDLFQSDIVICAYENPLQLTTTTRKTPITKIKTGGFEENAENVKNDTLDAEFREYFWVMSE